MMRADAKKISLRFVRQLANLQRRHDDLVRCAPRFAETAGQHRLREEWGTPLEFLETIESAREQFSPLERFLLFDDYVEEWNWA